MSYLYKLLGQKLVALMMIITATLSGASLKNNPDTFSSFLNINNSGISTSTNSNTNYRIASPIILEDINLIPVEKINIKNPSKSIVSESKKKSDESVDRIISIINEKGQDISSNPPIPKPATDINNYIGQTINMAINNTLNDIGVTIPQQITFTPDEKIRASLVNIFCTNTDKGQIKAVTGTGVLISKSGIVITNAHVAEYFLLSNYFNNSNLKCEIRYGSPANQSTSAEVIYMSSKWSNANARNIKNENLQETGQYDIALLKIQSNLSESKIPTNYLNVSINNQNIAGNKVIIGAYPGNSLGLNGIFSPLYIKTSNSEISDTFSFGSGQIETFETTFTNLAEPGSSGGAITDLNGNLTGLIVAIIDGKIRALNINHINSTLKDDLGIDLNSINNQSLNADPASIKQVFESKYKGQIINLLLSGLAS